MLQNSHVYALCRQIGPLSCGSASDACRLHEGFRHCFGEPTSPKEPWAVLPPDAGCTCHTTRCTTTPCSCYVDACSVLRCAYASNPGSQHQQWQGQSAALYPPICCHADDAPWEDCVMVMSQLARVLQLAISWLSAPPELQCDEPCNTPVTPMEQHSFGDQVCDATAVQYMRRIQSARHVCSALAGGYQASTVCSHQ